MAANSNNGSGGIGHSGSISFTSAANRGVGVDGSAANDSLPTLDGARFTALTAPTTPTAPSAPSAGVASRMAGWASSPAASLASDGNGAMRTLPDDAYGLAGDDDVEVTMTAFVELWRGITLTDADLDKAPTNYTTAYRTLALDCLSSIAIALGPSVHTQFVAGEKPWLRHNSRGAYAPTPVDTAHIALPADLEELVDSFAKRSHELWAQAKLKQGW